MPGSGKNFNSLGDFIAWWSIVKTEAEEFICEIRNGDVEIFKNGEDFSEYTANSLEKIANNMEAMIHKANIELKFDDD